MMPHICTNFHGNILYSLEVIERIRYSYEKKFKGGVIPQKMKVELPFLCSSHSLIIDYIYVFVPSFIKYLLKL